MFGREDCTFKIWRGHRKHTVDCARQEPSLLDYNIKRNFQGTVDISSENAFALFLSL